MPLTNSYKSTFVGVQRVSIRGSSQIGSAVGRNRPNIGTSESTMSYRTSIGGASAVILA